MSVRGTSIAIMDKGASSRYKDASSSQEMQSDWKIRKLRAELEEAEQATNDDLANEAKDKEARDMEAAVKEAKDRGAGGATCEVEEEGGRRSNSSEENGTTQRRRATKELRVSAAKFHPRREGRSQSRSGHLSGRWRESVREEDECLRIGRAVPR